MRALDAALPAVPSLPSAPLSALFILLAACVTLLHFFYRWRCLAGTATHLLRVNLFSPRRFRVSEERQRTVFHLFRVAFLFFFLLFNHAQVFSLYLPLNRCRQQRPVEDTTSQPHVRAHAKTSAALKKQKKIPDNQEYRARKKKEHT